jgi:hypothetical protein
LQRERAEYHRQLCERVVAQVIVTKKAKKGRTGKGQEEVLLVDADGDDIVVNNELFGTTDEGTVKVSYYNIADGDSASSVAIANRLIAMLGYPTASKAPKGQTAGAKFGTITCEYLERCFGHLRHLRPGRFEFSAAQPEDGILRYDQYAHLKTLSQFIKKHKELRSTLGGEYLIKPDIVVLKYPFTDAEINEGELLLLDGDCAGTHSPARASATDAATLHASVSCKWTMRSDRAQNVRTEALNLIRNRKGQSPRIVAVTAEPLPSRLVSIAIGTGDIDCTYHFALHELRAALEDLALVDQLELLDDLVVGRRLRDISDLPLDLII